MTRIIAGAARGRRLAVPGSGTRPTSDRVREAVFSSLDSRWRADEVAWSSIGVLDLYAGSGALGLEALSRGAVWAVLVEKSREAARILQANVEVVACPGARVLVRDVAHLPALTAPRGGAGLVFADPPYDLPAAALRHLLADLQGAGWLAPGALVVVERSARDHDSPLPPAWTEPSRRPYGDTVLWYGRAEPAADTAAGAEEDD